MNLRAQIIIIITTILSYSTGFSQNVDINEIRKIKKEQKIKKTYTFNRHQYVEIKSPLWEKSKEKRKILIKRISPKAYAFLDANSSLKIELLLEGIRKKRQIKEVLIQSYSSGLKRPKLISLVLQNEYSDLNFKILKISGKRYYNPLYYPRKYVFEKIINQGDNKQLSTYKFTPKKESKYLLNGYFNSFKDNQIDFFKATPSSKKSKVNSQLIFENTLIDSKVMPKYNESKTDITSNKRNFGKLEYKSSNRISNIAFTNEKLRSSNIILDFDKQLANQDSIDNSSNINKTLDYFEALRYGRLGINKVDVLLNHLVGYNPVEGLRLGFGLGSNSKFSDNFDFGGYAALGSRDRKFKYGGFSNFYIYKRTNSKLKLTYSDDLSEPGGVSFPYSKRLFLNEGFRKFGLSSLDRSKRFDAIISTSVLTNIFIQTGFTHKYHEPLYDYNFNNSNTFKVSEISFGMRYNPDEKFFKINNRLYSLGSKYPSFFVNYTKSLSSIYNYNRIDAKIEKNIKLMEYGEVDFQLIGGLINNSNLPYPFSYNMKGSFKAGTPVINNTFGTMGYNEFIASKYTALFYNHNIGKIADRSTFAPELILIQNIGFGDNINTINHELINLKSMEKGFFESGFYLKNLISFQNIIGQTGLGMGFMYRYGAYAYTKQSNNLVFKFSLDIDI